MEKQTRAYIYAGIAILSWSTVATAFKFGLKYQQPFQMLAGATLVTTVILFFTLIIQGKFKRLFTFTRKEYLLSILLGTFNPFIYYLILFEAYSILPAQVAQPLNLIWPIVLVLISAPLLGQKISLQSLVALFISFIGVILISSQGGGKDFSKEQIPGIILALGSSVIWSFYWILNVRDKRDDVIKLFLGFFFSLILLIVTSLLFSKNFPIGKEAWFWSGWVGIFEMSLAFIFWLKALNLTERTDKISNLIYIFPFISLFFIHFFVGESIHLTTIFGLFLIIAGIFVQRIGGRK
mgnify:FL=1